MVSGIGDVVREVVDVREDSDLVIKVAIWFQRLDRFGLEGCG